MRRRPARERALVLVAAAVSAVVGVVLVEILLSVLGADLAKATLAVVPSVVGFLIWVWSGATLTEAASWTVPLGILSVLGAELLPAPIDFASQVIVLSILVLMVFTRRAPAWWYQAILHRPLASDQEEV